MVKSIELPFNPKPSTYLHLDLNSCFATIEQQANPLLRGKPVAVAAYTTPSGCIVAPSVEAKRLGITVGMRVKDGRMLCPTLRVLPPDPWKYRSVHLALKKILETYTNDITPKSIDEFVLKLEGYPAFSRGMHVVAQEIKTRIKQEVGEWLTVSVGIAPNRFLAKTAASLHKPDGLDEIAIHNFKAVYAGLELTDLCGIKLRNATRLQNMGIHSVMDFYQASSKTLMGAFASIVGYYWYLRLKGWEIDDVEFGRRSFGNSYSLPKALSTDSELSPLLMKLTQKTSQRLRKRGYACQGVHLSILFRDGTHWHKGSKSQEVLFATNDIYRHIFSLFSRCPYRKSVANLAVSCFNLQQLKTLQLDIFNQTVKKESLTKAIDRINEKWGDYVLTPARMLGTRENVPDRIAFGGVKELEEIVLAS